MDESFAEVLKNFELPQRSIEDVKDVLLVILALMVFVFIVYLIHIARAKKRRSRLVRKSASARGLTRQELQIILGAVNDSPKIDAMKILNSLREFQRLFGPVMHELVGKMDTDPSARRRLNQIFALRKKLFGDVFYHFGALTTTLQLSIGQRMTLKFDYQGRSITADTVVLDVDSNAITVSNPRHEGEYLKLVPDQPIQVLFFRDKDAEYQFNTKVLRSTEQSNQPFLLLSHDLQVERIQSRQFYRVTTRIEFKFRRFVWDSRLDTRYLQKTEEKPEEFEGVIRNISAGGMLFSTAAKLKKEDILVFNLELSPELTIPDLLGKVLNVSELPEDRSLVHIRFVNIKAREQDQIVRMILQKKIRKEE